MENTTITIKVGEYEATVALHETPEDGRKWLGAMAEIATAIAESYRRHIYELTKGEVK